ncbi:MAG: Wzz/FepE/Etk N-terminal domain-containing protein [Candidatus Cohnella colombiensis]|uniref:Wzz/FepE/Etk N-terminal domain-containing protein n=1 Tax=Candidatus Cohnella colombiensis TaxID=3121368 RepID=A0AA95JG44_9BACL|nr:MAG: Wzz/FepE/Etk N-terminal domain-containing protein [Cohnella sp.]
MEFIEYLKIVYKRLWLILLIVGIATTVAAVYSEREYVPIYGATTKLIVSKTQNQDQLINTYKEIIKTPAIMNKVVQKYPELDISAKELITDVDIYALSGTQVMSIYISDYSYVRAARIVNAVSNVFQTEIPLLIDAEQIKVLNEADEFEPYPVPLNAKNNQAAIVSFVISMLFGVGVAFLLEFLDDTLKTEEDIQQMFDCSTLATIAKTKNKKYKRSTVKKQQKKAGDLSGAAYSPLNR